MNENEKQWKYKTTILAKRKLAQAEKALEVAKERVVLYQELYNRAKSNQLNPGDALGLWCKSLFSENNNNGSRHGGQRVTSAVREREKYKESKK